ncbi:MAG TPA: hypothetical protein VIX87_08645 [Steroidobacteraceae bacterium]
MIFVVTMVCLIGASFVMLLVGLVLDRLQGPAELVPVSRELPRVGRDTGVEGGGAEGYGGWLEAR